MNKTIFLSGIIFGVLAVLFGAFGAHGLEKLVDADAIQTWETGVTYQMYHALLLLTLANVKAIPEHQKKWIFYAIVAGIILFSFSIYGLVLSDAKGKKLRFLGPITPVGGLLLIAGWLQLLLNAII